MDQNRSTPLEDLTPRDIDVLTLLAEGLMDEAHASFGHYLELVGIETDPITVSE